MRLLAYDYEALTRIAEQTPWGEGMAVVRQWTNDLRTAARAETGFGTELAGMATQSGAASGERQFDPARLAKVLAHLEVTLERLGGDRPLRELVGDFPGKNFAEVGYDGWALYEDLVRVWTALVSPRWTDACLLASDGAGSLLGPLGAAMKKDLRLASYSPSCKGTGKPYPITWRDKPRARIYHVATQYLEQLREIGTTEVEKAATIARRTPAELAERVSALVRHFELARQYDLVVAIDPDDSVWA